LDVNNPVVSVIVPVYNEQETISSVLRELLKLDSEIPSIETIVIDDGSTDGTQNEIARFPSVRYIRHERNLGKGRALRTGFAAAKGKVIAIQDADLEYQPKQIPSLVGPICSGHVDAVFGSRFIGKRNGMSFSHTVGNIMLSKITSLLFRTNITDVMTGHKAFSSRILNSVNLKERGFGIEVELTAKILKDGCRILEVPIEYSYRTRGVTKIRYRDGLKCLLKLLRIALFVR
jgi:glycosyltransferase involved in cell wall biosynthesis